MNLPSLEDALDRLPIFPLPEVVLFPEAVLPLHVFEPRYRTMLRDCLRTHGAMAVAQIVPGVDEHGRPRIAAISGGGVVVEHEPLGDGRAKIVLLGRARLRLDEFAPDDAVDALGQPLPYRLARAEVLDDLPVLVPERDRAALVAAAAMFVAELKRHEPSVSVTIPATLDAAHLADLSAYQLVADPEVRQAALRELDPRARVAMVFDALIRQRAALAAPSGGGERGLN